jgi:hypothetical protein
LEKEKLLAQVGERFFSSFGITNYAWRNEYVIRNMNKGISVRLIPYRHIVLSGGIKGFIKRQLATIIEFSYPISIFVAPEFELVGHINEK